MDTWSLRLLGISYKETSLDMRERVSLGPKQVITFLGKLKKELGIKEAFVLSTCNRHDLYYAPPEGRAEEELKENLLRRMCSKSLKMMPYFYHITDTKQVVEHLYKVALGMDAQVLGEQQVFHQSKEAYKLAAEMDMAGPHLHRLMHVLFYTHKRVCKESTWYEGGVSVASTAVDLLGQWIKNNKKITRILLIGTGEVGNDICRNLSYLTIKKEVYLVNRTPDVAEIQSKNYGYQTLSFDAYAEALNSMDVIITATSQGSMLIKKEMFSPREMPRYFLDLSVPRNIDPQIGTLAGNLLYNIDQVNDSVSSSVKQRQQAVPEVEKIMAAELEAFRAWCQENTFSPAIQLLKDALERLRKEEMQCHVKDLSEEENEKMDKITRALIQRILKYPVLGLKVACKRGEADSLVSVLLDLFDIEKEKELSKP